ncbi:MAG: YdcF family protein [Lachnospiraceae bacterium]|nr:YdcF family protein [Lachnospiraceae bacterium]
MSVIIGLFLALLGLLSIIYGIVMALGAHGSMFFIIWFFLGALFIAVGILKLRKILIPHTPLLIIRIAVAAIIILFIVVESFILSGFNSKAHQDADYLIVAGAQVYANGPSPVLKYRLDTAAEYLKNNPSTVCIVTGGKGSNEVRPEAEIMAEYLVSKGIDGERILLENLSTNTAENMKNAAKLFDIKNSTAVIVTSNFHLFRTMRIARRQGIVNISGLAADSNTLFLPNNLLREFCGVCKDFLFGHM